jgi:lipopolysaccharide export system permease protein
MKQINKYILRATIAPFFFGTGVVIFLFLMQFLTKHLDKLVGKGLENEVIFLLIVYNIAWMIILAIPLGVLFASLMAFGNLASNSEITIIKSSGGSFVKMILPVLIASMILSYALFLYDSEVIPETNHNAKVLLYDIQRKKPIFSIEQGQFCNEIDGYTILARAMDTATNTLFDVTIYDLKNMNMSRTINAKSCNIVFSSNMKNIDFFLHHGEIFQSQIGDVKNYRQIKFNDYYISALANGFGFERSDSGTIGRGDREMRIDDMQAIVDEANQQIQNIAEKNKIQMESYINFLINGAVEEADDKPNYSDINSRSRTDLYNPNLNNPTIYDRHNNIRNNNFNYAFQKINEFTFYLQSNKNSIRMHQERSNRYEVEIQKKYAIPFACIIFVLIGCPLGVITRGGNFGLSAAITLGFYVVY